MIDDRFAGSEPPPGEVQVETTDEGTTTYAVPGSVAFAWEDDGPDPVFAGSQKCWRRYRIGGWVTMLDPFDCNSLE